MENQKGTGVFQIEKLFPHRRGQWFLQPKDWLSPGKAMSAVKLVTTKLNDGMLIKMLSWHSATNACIYVYMSDVSCNQSLQC